MKEGFEERFQDALSSLIGGRAIEADDVRATALNTLADLILETDRLGERRIPAHFGELMQALLPRVGPHVRAGIARRLAPCDLVPVEIVRLIAADAADIAAPMLRQSPVLTGADLAAIAVGDCDEKARAIAGRTGLTSDIVSALIDRRDPVIGAALALSPSPVIDEAGAERLARIPNLPRVAARRLIEMAGLSDPALAALFWLAEADTRRTILERIAGRHDRKAGPEHSDNVELGEALFALAAVGERPEIAERLARALTLPRALGARIVGDLQGEALTVALRAAGIGADKATGIILLTVSEAGRSYDVLRTLAGLAEALHVATARHIVGLWSGEGVAERPAARHAPAVARPSGRAPRAAGQPSRRLEDVVADLTRRTGS